MSTLSTHRRLVAPQPMLPPLAVARAQAAPTLSYAFGSRFFLLLLIGLIWLGPAWWDQQFLWGLLAWDAVLLAFWVWDARQLPRPEQLELCRHWRGIVTLASESVVEIELINHGRIPVRAVVVDDASTALLPVPPSLELAAPPGGSGCAGYPILPVARGDARLGAAFLRYQSPARLAERWARADLAQTVRVYPNLEEAKRHTIYLIRSRQVELEKRLKRLRGRGHEFESLREYREGDELRDICWTATARRAVPITKVYQLERSQPVWLCLDAGRLLRARVRQLSKLDYAVNATLALAHVALFSGDRVGLIAYGRQVQQRLNAGRGSPHLRALVEQLAFVRAEPYEADHLRAAQLVLSVQKHRSLVVWLTDLAETPATPEVIESALLLAQRHLVLFAVVGHPELSEAARQRPQNEEEMYRTVAAVEMVQRRDLLLGRLRQRGVLTLELTAENLAVPLVNQYLEIKERRLL
ncbi:MAG: DUF58 domain-containing protein [Acidobacteria bacterium]|nr:DUF58 domain-containing protein [Acidobacteriota bacterium]MBI3663036.1 DUF58 domain-containing protein [Acidobacteriota bacterium]